MVKALQKKDYVKTSYGDIPDKQTYTTHNRTSKWSINNDIGIYQRSPAKNDQRGII